MSGATGMKSLADNIGKYIMDKFVAPRLANMVCFYKAEVVAGISGGKITIRKPFDTATYALPCVGSASGLAQGDVCTVFCLGSASNAIIIGDGRLSNL